MSAPLRICKKCLIRNMDKEQYFEDLTRYIQDLEEEVRVDQEMYEMRLSICGACPNQMDGMCRLCGCYVELRAALKVRKCPDIPARWDSQKES